MSAVTTTSTQYDLTKLIKGNAIHVKQTTSQMLDVDAIIIEVTPINIKVAYLNDRVNKILPTVDIAISEITTSVTTVSLLVNPDTPIITP